MPTRSRWAAILTLVVLIAALWLPPAAASVTTDVLGYINGSRAGRGLEAMSGNSSMDAVAQSWAEHLAEVGSLSHNPDYPDQIPQSWTAVAENIAYTTSPSASGMHTQLMNSAPHRANILGSFTHVGVGFATGSNGVSWLVEVFATYPGSLSGDFQVAAIQGSSGSGGGGGQAAATSSPTVPAGWLGPGSSGAEVEALQHDLTSLGYAVNVDGDFGEQTAQQVRAFQSDSGLAADGLAGPETLAAIEAAMAALASPSVTPTASETPTPSSSSAPSFEQTPDKDAATGASDPQPQAGTATFATASDSGRMPWLAGGAGLVGATALWLLMRYWRAFATRR